MMGRILSILACLLVAGCFRGPQEKKLSEIASLVQERPDSALTELRAMSQEALRSRRLRAEFSLLHAMALDKCYIDVASDSIIAPAAEYYRHHGNFDDKLKALYYQGLVHRYRGELREAAVLFSKAEGIAGNASDAHAKGILFLSFANLYGAVHNFDKQQEYVEKALEVLFTSGDPMYESALVELASVHVSRREWKEADSLYRKSLAAAEGNEQILSYVLSAYARMKMMLDTPDPSGAIALLRRKVEECNAPLTQREAGAYAYAADRLGETAVTDALLAQFEGLTGPDRAKVLPWMYRIYAWRGDYEKAFKYLSEADVDEEKDIRSSLADPLTQAISDNLELEMERKRTAFRIAMLVFVFLTMLLLSAVSFLAYRRKKQEEEIARLLLVSENLRRENADSLKQVIDLTTRLKSQKHTLSNRNSENSSMRKTLEALRIELSKERLVRFQQKTRLAQLLSELENGPWPVPSSISGTVKSELREVYSLERDRKALLDRLDSELDGMVGKMIADLGLTDSKDIHFLCLSLLGIRADVVSGILKMNRQAVYTKKARLKSRLESVGGGKYGMFFD